MDNHEKRISELEKWRIEVEKRNIINSYDMKELIIDSVAKRIRTF